MPFLSQLLDCFLSRPVACLRHYAVPSGRQTILSRTATERHRISTHPDVNFTVVINPGNGPGPDSLPDGNYTREIPKLTAYANVRLLGYVYTSYGKRNVSAVRKDIQTYADWPNNSSNPSLAVRGIFFDETPQQYEAQTLTYLQGLTDFVKDLKDLGPDQFVSVAILPKLYSLSHTIHPLSRIILDLYFHFFIILSSFSFFISVGLLLPCHLSPHHGFINFHPNTTYSIPACIIMVSSSGIHRRSPLS